MSWTDALLRRPSIYRYFHLVFSGAKFVQLRAYLQTREGVSPLRVLDLGCGPGTSAVLFTDRARYQYLGIDNNPKYIEDARQAYAMDFQCGDITTMGTLGGSYDVVLINSVFHHLGDDQVMDVLDSVRTILDPRGDFVVLDMIRPRNKSFANALQRLLIRLDRGEFCRTLESLEGLLHSRFELARTESFSIGMAALGIVLWDLRLFVCRIPSGSRAAPTKP